MAWIPNALTVLRLCLTPVIYLTIARYEFGFALALVMIAGFSDWLDGVLARRFNWHSRLGSLLDPIADKLLFLAVFIGLTLTDLMPLWLAVLAIARDVVIVVGATAYNFTVERLTGSATLLSKFNTLMQGVYACVLLGLAATGRDAEWLVKWLSAALLVTIVASGVHYVIAWSRKAREGASDE
ncbi:MAG: CDP-alcohol phosphatidyltransferase family protein [Pseudomonadota bacterium]